MAGTPAPGAAPFSCPPNFTAVSPNSDSSRLSLEALTHPDTELWLIRAPSDFAPQCLNGRHVPLSGSKTVKGKLDGQRYRYRVLTSSPQAGEATLLASSTEAGGRLTCAPAPHGSLRIMEGPQMYVISRVPLQPVPTSLPPQIPAGLRPRFSAFGGNPPVTGPGSPASGKKKKKKKKRKVTEASALQEAGDGHGATEVDTAWGGLEMGVRKKKKKKMKHPAGEAEMTEAEAMEPVRAEAFQPQEEPGHEEAQPADGFILSPTKKRKRRKEAKGVEAAEEGALAGSQPQVAVEPQEEATLLPPTKKKRKKERQNLVMEPGVGLCGVITEPELSEPGLRAEAAPVSPKKMKKEKKEEKCRGEALALGAEVTEALSLSGSSSQQGEGERTEGYDRVPSEMTDPREPAEPEAGAAQGSTKKKKKDLESGV